MYLEFSELLPGYRINLLRIKLTVNLDYIEGEGHNNYKQKLFGRRCVGSLLIPVSKIKIN